MPVTIYNDGTKYGDADADYGRISAAMSTAQDAFTRETALRVGVINRHLNDWEYFAGTSLPGIDLYRPLNAGRGNADPLYYTYRASSDTCILSNGNIIRIRNGTDTDATDRQIWVQTITDPLDAPQWSVWSVLYSGVHYNCAIIANGTAFITYHSKADGFYRNDVKVYDITDFEPVENSKAGFALGISPVKGKIDAVYLVVLHADDILSTAGQPARDINLYYVEDMSVPTVPKYDQTNFRMIRNGIASIVLPDGRIGRVQSNSWYFDPREGNRGNALLSMFCADDTLGDDPLEPYLIRGIGGGSGFNFANVLGVHLLSDGFYYLLTAEVHEDRTYAQVTNVRNQISWQRSKDMVYWSDPMASGITAWGGTELIESSGYVWLPDNGAVWRRPIAADTTDISNYVPTLDFEIPRDNQPSSGEMVVANPAGINDALKNLSDREVTIEIGLRTGAGIYEYREWNKWFLVQVDRILDNPANRLNLTFGDLWARLDNAFRDTINIVGQIAWRDWIPDGRNKSFNYFFRNDASQPATKEANGDDLTTLGIVLYTGWKGLNGFFQAQFNSFTSGKPRLIFRYIDNANYMFIEYDAAGTLALRQVFENVTSTIDTASVTSGSSSPLIGIRIRWGYYDLYYGGVVVLSDFWTDPDLIHPGYVGFSTDNEFGSYHIQNFTLDEWEQTVTTAELVKRALACGDFHDVLISSGDGRQIAITWGPQTDLPTPAAALLQAITSEKLQVIWRDGFVEVGKFTDSSPIKVIEDRIISSSETDNSGKRINFASVDGNDKNWLQFDIGDIQARDREINAYFDLPELMDQSAVTARAEEEIRLSARGHSPQGVTPLYFDLWRTDCVIWVDGAGQENLVRIEGYKVDINQSLKPFQHQEFDTSIISSAESTSVSGVEEQPPVDDAAPTPPPVYQPSNPGGPPPPTPSVGRPWPAPTITATVSLSGADATGATNATAAIISFINAQADGTQINFSPTGIYRLDTAIKFNNKHHIVLNLQGAEFRCNGTGFTEDYSAFYVQQGCSHIAINGGIIKGTSPTPGVFISGHEGQHGILNDGATYVESGSMNIQGLFGDAFYTGKPGNHVWYHDSTVINTGRNGLSVISSSDVKYESNTLGTMGYMPFDVEPNLSSEPTDGVVIINNTVATWSNAFFAADGAAAASIQNITVDGNLCTGKSLLCIVDLPRRRNVRFTNNESLVSAAGPILRFAHVDGLVVQHNIQPLSSGSLLSVSDCPGAVTSPNP